MRVLLDVKPTPEQLTVITDPRPGAVVVRGAAGSGKTTTALLRLRQTTAYWRRLASDGRIDGPVRVLALTFNRTLRGYIEELAAGRLDSTVDLELNTFGSWARKRAGAGGTIVEATSALTKFAHALPLPQQFVKDEATYVTGRFLPSDRSQYLTVRREGRGITPRMDRSQREALFASVIEPYEADKRARGLRDWDDIATAVALGPAVPTYHVLLVDEAQDFSANQIRAISQYLHDDHSATYVIDAAQRIYPREFTWREAGIGVRRSYRLARNYRNTRQIAAFARPLLEGIEIADDGTLPDLDSCRRAGPLPRVVEGRFTKQVDDLIATIRSLPAEESIAVLHALGGGWFSDVEARLKHARIPYVDLSRLREWPKGPEQVGLSTMHSAKGLEFDHVYVIGLNEEVAPVGDTPADNTTAVENYRRLLAMAICRARHSVTIAYKPEEASTLVQFLQPATYERVRV